MSALQNSDINSKINDLEGVMLTHDQVECPLKHHFGPGIYIRECFMPAGTLVVGHHHIEKTVNNLVQGRLRVFVNGEVKELSAPTTFVSEPGRKVAYILEDVVWQNVIATDETDVEAIEARLIDKSKSILTKEEFNKISSEVT